MAAPGLPGRRASRMTAQAWGWASGRLRPGAVMERLSAAVETASTPRTRGQLFLEAGGRHSPGEVHDALVALCAEGYVQHDEVDDVYLHVRAYRQERDPLSPLYQPAPGPAPRDLRCHSCGTVVARVPAR